jgi:hypothetical protein
MKQYNHMMDVAFTVVSSEARADKLGRDELIDAMEKRLECLKLDKHAVEAFGLCDTYEEDDPESDDEPGWLPGLHA